MEHIVEKVGGLKYIDGIIRDKFNMYLEYKPEWKHYDKKTY